MKKYIRKFLLLEANKKFDKLLSEYSFLILRVSAGLTMLFAHGIGKIKNFSNIAPNFPDPFGFLGSTLSLALVVGSEFFGAIFLALGLLTRWSSFSLMFTMFVAAFIIHGPDPFKDKELAVIYGLIYLYFTLSGGGKYSLDHYLKKIL